MDISYCFKFSLESEIQWYEHYVYHHWNQIRLTLLRSEDAQLLMYQCHVEPVLLVEDVGDQSIYVLHDRNREMHL